MNIETEDGPINVISNGSKWMGQQPDNLETLARVLGEHPLDLARFAAYGFIGFEDNGRVRLFGNFLTISHVFNIEGPESQLKGIVEAIKKNIDRQFSKEA